MVDFHEIVTLARRHGLDLTGDGLEISEIGLDFRVAFAPDTAGTDWVLRIPRRPDAVLKAEVEGRVLELLRARTGIRVPEWRVSTPELIAYPRLTGTTAVVVDAGTMTPAWKMDPKSPAFAESLGAALADLHRVDHGAALKAGVPVRSPADVRRSVQNNHERVRRELGVSDGLWSRWQRWIDDESYWPQHSAFTHGNLHVGHIVIDEASRVSGILDWTEASVGDPAVDFIFHLKAFEVEGLERLIAAYEQAGGRVWPRMKEHVSELLAAFPAKYALFALTTGNEEHLTAARAWLSEWGSS